MFGQCFVQVEERIRHERPGRLICRLDPAHGIPLNHSRRGFRLRTEPFSLFVVRRDYSLEL